MKISITFKDPDGVANSIQEGVHESVASLNLSEEEIDVVEGVRRETVSDALKAWIDCGEYITVDFDTDAGTATVRRNKK